MTVVVGKKGRQQNCDNIASLTDFVIVVHFIAMNPNF